MYSIHTDPQMRQMKKTNLTFRCFPYKDQWVAQSQDQAPQIDGSILSSPHTVVFFLCHPHTPHTDSWLARLPSTPTYKGKHDAVKKVSDGLEFAKVNMSISSSLKFRMWNKNVQIQFCFHRI